MQNHLKSRISNKFLKLVTTIIVVLAIPTLALADDSKLFIVVDKDCRSEQFVQSDVPAQIINGRTLVPIRAVSEALGLIVDWDSSNQTAIIYNPNGKVAMRIPLGSTDVMVYGEHKTIDVPAQSISDRTFVPLRFVGESLGYQIKYIKSSKTTASVIYVTPYTVTPDLPSPFISLEPDNIVTKEGFHRNYSEDGAHVASFNVTDPTLFGKDFEYGKTTLAQIEEVYGKAFFIDYSPFANPKHYIYRIPFIPEQIGGWGYTFEVTGGILTNIMITPKI